jgi:hypothetical protein
MIQKMLEDGIIQPREVSLSSSMVMVTKNMVHGICAQLDNSTK